MCNDNITNITSRGGSRKFPIVGLNARVGGKYRKPHLLISVDHTQIITYLVVSQKQIVVTGRGKNKCGSVNLSAVSPPTLTLVICACFVVKASCTGW